MDPMSLNNAIPTATEVDVHVGAPPTVRSRSSSPSRVTRGHVEKGEPSSSKAQGSTPTTYPPPNPNGHTTTGPEVPQPFSSGGAAIVEPTRAGRPKERTTFTEKVGNLFKSKSRGRSRSKSKSRAVDGTLNPTVA